MDPDCEFLKSQDNNTVRHYNKHKLLGTARLTRGQKFLIKTCVKNVRSANVKFVVNVCATSKFTKITFNGKSLIRNFELKWDFARTATSWETGPNPRF